MVLTKNDRKSLYGSYKDALVRFPLIINGIQSAILTSIGVLISQYLSSKDSWKFDLNEVRVMALISVVVNTPMLHYFYKYLSNSGYSAVIQVLIDQFSFSIALNFLVLSARLLLLHGTSFAAVPFAALKLLPTVMFYCWFFWIPARYLTISYIPSYFHLLTSGICAVAWRAIFCIVINGK